MKRGESGSPSPSSASSSSSVSKNSSSNSYQRHQRKSVGDQHSVHPLLASQPSDSKDLTSDYDTAKQATLPSSSPSSPPSSSSSSRSHSNSHSQPHRGSIDTPSSTSSASPSSSPLPPQPLSSAPITSATTTPPFSSSAPVTGPPPHPSPPPPPPHPASQFLRFDPEQVGETSPLQSYPYHSSIHAMYTAVPSSSKIKDLEQPFTPNRPAAGAITTARDEEDSGQAGQQRRDGKKKWQKLTQVEEEEMERGTGVRGGRILDRGEDEDEMDGSPSSVSFRFRSAYRRCFSLRNRPLYLFFLFLFVVLFFPLFAYFRSSRSSSSSTDPSPYPFISTCDIFCFGPILSTLQLSSLFNDSKSFVDMPLRHSPSEVYSSFLALPDHSRASLLKFLVDNFETEGSDVLPWSPEDWVENPPILSRIADPTFKQWASGINSLWHVLGRAIAPDVSIHPDRHTLLPLRHPYMIVPGGRFREFYYWDSYWIVRGLLLSNMRNTSLMIIENLCSLVDRFGFIPNGSRQYYLTRSQPPFLSLMVDYFYNQTGEIDIIRKHLPTMEKEYEYWMRIGGHAVRLRGKSGQNYTMNRYFAKVDYPRPESFLADEYTASLLETNSERERRVKEEYERVKSCVHSSSSPAPPAPPTESSPSPSASSSSSPSSGSSSSPASSSSSDVCHSSAYESDSPSTPFLGSPPSPLDSERTRLFSELTAGAETGWDFSSRWFEDRENLTTVQTSEIIPVDLNAIMFAVEVTLSKFYSILKEAEQTKREGQTSVYDSKISFYRLASISRSHGIHEFLWDESSFQWQDYNHVHQVRNWGGPGVLSNFIPLWTKCYNRSEESIRQGWGVNESLVIDSLVSSGLILSGGMVTTVHDVGKCCQWDFPNAWPPLQHMIAEGILTSEYQPLQHTTKSYLEQIQNQLPEGFAEREYSTLAHTVESMALFTTRTLSSSSLSFSSSPPSSSPSSSSLSLLPFPRSSPSSPYGPLLSFYLSSRWLYSNLLAYNSTGFMLEKYYAPKLGSPGGGGEYRLQTGFGWTNGVALIMLDRYAKELNITQVHNHIPIYEWGKTNEEKDRKMKANSQRMADPKLVAEDEERGETKRWEEQQRLSEASSKLETKQQSRPSMHRRNDGHELMR